MEFLYREYLIINAPSHIDFTESFNKPITFVEENFQ